MPICSSCGNQVKEILSVCPHCGKILDPEVSDYDKTRENRRSSWWYGLPIAFGIVGGVAAYFAINNTDPKKAKECLIIGLGMLGVWFSGLFI